MFLVSCGGGSAPNYIPPDTGCSTHTLRWVLPTTDTRGVALGAIDITHGTLYVTSVPMVEVADMQIEVDAYTLMFVRDNVPLGTRYYRMTVSNEHGESDFSNTVSKTCP